MHPLKIRRFNSNRNRSATLVGIIPLLIILSVTVCHNHNDGPTIVASASAVAPLLTAVRSASRSRRGSSSESSTVVFATAAVAAVETTTASSAAAVVAPDSSAGETASDEDASITSSGGASNASSSSSNPIAQLAGYVKESVASFKNGMFQMNADHRRCNDLRAKQRAFALSKDTYRPRGARGIQTGGVSYEEYDFLRKGLVDRNKLFAVAVVSLCLPNYFVYYLWSFPDMMPSPFLKGKDPNEISRERCHAVISTLLDMEKGARVAPWSSKLNPFGKKATERAMGRLGDLVTLGCASMEEYGATGSAGGRRILKKLKPQLYLTVPLTKQQRLLAGNTIPKQIIKGLTKAIGADPLNKGSSPFGIGAVKHIESVTLADEFLVDQSVEIDSINSDLLAEACSARLIGGPGWTDGERREALVSWLQEMEVKPREAIKNDDDGDDDDDKLHYNGNLARAALMCYNVVDGTRDSRSDSSLLRAMYRGQVMAE